MSMDPWTLQHFYFFLFSLKINILLFKEWSPVGGAERKSQCPLSGTNFVVERVARVRPDKFPLPVIYRLTKFITNSI